MSFSRRLSIAALVCAVATAWLAAVITPARSIEVPMTVARNVHLGGAAGRVSVGLTPTHIAFSWRGDEGEQPRYRVVSNGSVSSWREARESEEMKDAGRHFSAVFVVDRPEVVEWDARGGSLEAVTLHEMNTVDGPRRTIEIPAGAQALAATPNIVTRAEWGADESIKRTVGGCRRRFFDVQQLFVHHTAGTNNDPNPAATMRAIYWYHVRDRGWCDIGYNFVIGSDGSVFEARWARNYGQWESHDSENSLGRAVVGAHVSGFNSGSVGISLMGNYETASLSEKARASLVGLLAWEADRHDLPAMGAHSYRNPETGRVRRLPYIAGHRDAGETACPGRRVYSALKKIRADVAAVVESGKETARVRLRPGQKTIDFGEQALVAGTLFDETGVPLSDRSVTLYKRGPRRPWRQAGSQLVDERGRFLFVLNLQRNSDALVSFAGDETTWEDASGIRSVGVRPLVSLVPTEGKKSEDVYYFNSSVSAVRLAGDVRPLHPGGRVTVSVLKRRSDGSYRELVARTLTIDSAGGFRYRFVLPPRRPGTYKATARFRGDADHLAASSRRVQFVITAK